MKIRNGKHKTIDIVTHYKNYLRHRGVDVDDEYTWINCLMTMVDELVIKPEKAKGLKRIKTAYHKRRR